MSLRLRTALFGAYCVCLVGLFHAPVAELIHLATKNASSSHLPFIPLLAAALVLRGRDEIFASASWSWGRGLALIGVTLVTWLTARLSASGSPASLSVAIATLVALTNGGFLLFFGWRAFRAALFPLAFMALTAPIPAVLLDAATRALKTGSTEAVAALFTLTGTTYHREGFVFSLAPFSIEVADECSGIRSSIALMLTALLAGHATLARPWTKALLVLAVVPVTIFKNGIRIVTLCLLSLHVDPSYLTGQLHHEGGVVFFILALAILSPVLPLLRRLEKPANP